jgi:Helix-turn-helix domain
LATERKKHRAQGRDKRKHVPGTILPFVVREVRASLSSSAWSVWTALFQHANRNGYCWMKNENIQVETGLAKNTVDRVKLELIDKGWLENCGQRGGRGANTTALSLAFRRTSRLSLTPFGKSSAKNRGGPAWEKTATKKVAISSIGFIWTGLFER